MRQHSLSGLLRWSFLAGLMLLLLPALPAQIAKIPDRKHFYEAMQLDKKELITAQLKALKNAPADIKAPFEGAMLMKQAGLGANPAKKLSQFKKGHLALEQAIRAHPDNAEYRFLRLMIQEHAPGILGYNNDLSADGEYIRKSYRSLPTDVQQAIRDYDKKSKVLKLGVS